VETLEHKGERFIIKAKVRESGYPKEVKPRKLRARYDSDIIIKHGGVYLFLKYIEPATFTDIDEPNQPKLTYKHDNEDAQYQQYDSGSVEDSNSDEPEIDKNGNAEDEVPS